MREVCATCGLPHPCTSGHNAGAISIQEDTVNPETRGGEDVADSVVTPFDAKAFAAAQAEAAETAAESGCDGLTCDCGEDE